MYLRDLNDAQKALTLDLLIHASDANRHGEGARREQIEIYCAVMGIPARLHANLDKDTALRQLTEISNTVTLRKVLVELMMLAVSDAEFDGLERAFGEKFAVLTERKQSEYEESLRLLEELTRARQRLDELVNEPG